MIVKDYQSININEFNKGLNEKIYIMKYNEILIHCCF